METIKYFREDLTNAQKLYSCITGWEGEGNPMSAAHTEYFELDSMAQQVECLHNYAWNLMNEYVDEEICWQVAKAIEHDRNDLDMQGFEHLANV